LNRFLEWSWFNIQTIGNVFILEPSESVLLTDEFMNLEYFFGHFSELDLNNLWNVFNNQCMCCLVWNLLLFYPSQIICVCLNINKGFLFFSLMENAFEVWYC
jgi:hypothetical protein